MSTPSIQPRIQLLIDALCEQLYEKDRIVRMVLLSAIAGESAFLLGPPGVAKSLIARRLKFAFADARAFEYLMGKFSTPDEVFGPVSIKKLKDEDSYQRLTTHYLPGANIVFLDEIWKASPPIQNSLLTVLNEKIYRNGEQEQKVDLRALVAASNELPLKGEGLEALWDRFLLRLMVYNIEEETHFADMLNLPRGKGLDDPVPAAQKIDSDTYFRWQLEIDQVHIPNHVMGLLQAVRREILIRSASVEDDFQLYVSDRRWRKIAQLLRTSAFLHDREEVIVMDGFLIIDCIWDEVEQIELAKKLVEETVIQSGYRHMIDTDPMEEELESLREEIDKATHEVRVKEEEVLWQGKDAMGVAFLRMPNFWGDTYGYVRTSDVAKLMQDEDDMVSIPVFEKTQNGYKPFQTYPLRRVDAFTLHDPQRARPLDKETLTREERVPVLPPEGLKKIWDSQIMLLLEHCEKGLDALEAQLKRDEAYTESHMFVDDSYGPAVMQSLENTLNDLTNLKLEIAQLRHNYESVEAD